MPLSGLSFRHPALRELSRETYTLAELLTLEDHLHAVGLFAFPPYPNGLFPAANLVGRNRYTQYDNVWVRDTVHIAHALYHAGRIREGVQALQTLLAFLTTQLPRFDAIIAEPERAKTPDQRPHIRFKPEGDTFVSGTWAHAQNDALGLTIWFALELLRDGTLPADDTLMTLLGRFVDYMEAIDYAHDADQGHWEEAAKVECSSVGMVVAALRALQEAVAQHLVPPELCATPHETTSPRLARLIAAGEATLAAFLPWETRSPAPTLARRYDSALLFLIHPVDVLSPSQARQIVHDVTTMLSGPIGIRRYLGDSYWSPDYDRHVREELRATDVSAEMGDRDRLAVPGQEAQWCIFDSTLSTIHGHWYQREHRPEDLARQIWHFNRTLAQITGPDSRFGPYNLPESYFLSQGTWIETDQTPLNWAKANLLTALTSLKHSVGGQV